MGLLHKKVTITDRGDDRVLHLYDKFMPRRLKLETAMGCWAICPTRVIQSGRQTTLNAEVSNARMTFIDTVVRHRSELNHALCDSSRT
jgi:hypothetical protein